MNKTAGKVWAVSAALAMIAVSVAAVGWVLLGNRHTSPEPNRTRYSGSESTATSAPSTPSVGAPAAVTAPPARELTAVESKTVASFLHNPRAVSIGEIAAIHHKAPAEVRAQLETTVLLGKTDAAELQRQLIDQATADLQSNDAHRQELALHTATHLATPRLRDAAREILVTNAQPALTAAALDYLGRVNCSAAFADGLRRAKPDQPLSVRQAAWRNLMLLGGRDHIDELLPVLEAALADSDVTLQSEALKALGRVPAAATPTIREKVVALAERPVPAGQADSARETACLLVSTWAAPQPLSNVSDVTTPAPIVSVGAH